MVPIRLIGATYIPVRAEKYQAGINCRLQITGSKPTRSMSRVKLSANRAMAPLISSRFQILIDPLFKMLKRKSLTEGSPKGVISGSDGFSLVLLDKVFHLFLLFKIYFRKVRSLK